LHLAAPVVPSARALLVLLALSVLTACAGGNLGSRFARAPRFEPEGETKCGLMKSQAHPLIVEWPSADRLTLENKIREGVVAVRYVGCEMRVLERCTVSASYAYLGATRSEDKVIIKDEDDLYTNLPLGAAKLEAKLLRSGELTVDMDLVGRYEASRPAIRADELHGECEGATHFVYGVAVGAFDFHAGADATVGVGASFAGVGASGQSQAERETLKKSGDEAACARATREDKAPPEGCGALVRIEVVPIGAPAPVVPVCPDGTTWDGKACLAHRLATAVDCPEGSTWNGAACTSTRVVTQVQCPPGAWWNGKACEAKIACPEGMAWLGGGSFKTSGGYADVDPADGITLKPLCMDNTEVTVAAYADCVHAGRCNAVGVQMVTDGKALKIDPLCNYGPSGRDTHPMNCVDWTQAQTFCHVQGKRLPTEWEWVWASLGGIGPGAGTTDVPTAGGCWKDKRKADGTCPVDRDGVSGISDLDGNVAEWTASKHPWGGMVARGASWAEPHGAFAGVLTYAENRVMADTPARARYSPSIRRDDLGFRCVR
jgi:formylglycine-generating enzyme required for sulfatase activity